MLLWKRWSASASLSVKLLPAIAVLILGVLVATRSQLLHDRVESVETQYDRVASKYDTDWSKYVRLTTGAAHSRFQEKILANLRIDNIPRISSSSTHEKQVNVQKVQLLDVGTGTGALISAIAQMNADWNYTGIDLSLAMLAEAAKKCPTCTFIKATAEALPFQDAQFDAIVTLSSFHFWTDRTQGVVEIRRVLKQGGFLLLSDWDDDTFSCKICSWYLWFSGFSEQDWSLCGHAGTKALLQAHGFYLTVADQHTIDLHPLGMSILPKWGMMTYVAQKIL